MIMDWILFLNIRSRAVGGGQWAVDSGQWAVSSEQLAVGSEQ
jgi:hypothetical protein